MALQRLGPFELLRVLGRGGMGTVYEAREQGSDERVAVKALAPAYSFDDHFRNRFEAEIDALMSLDHQNIVRLLSYGQDEGNLYFAMELVDGTSLFQEQKQGQVFHWQEIVDIGIQVCEGLRHAHDRGIIHRDLKPGNLMIDADRQVKITDFGIAKSFGQSSLTSEGNVLGTMDFMAPEQARGMNVNARSDLFSLGAVMYSLLAGRPPFLKDSVEMTFEALLSPEPPPRLDKIAPDIPRPLSQLIHRLMEKDPNRRIATALATGRQLAHVRDQVKMDPRKMDTQVVGQDMELTDTANTRVVGDYATGEREVGETAERSEFRNQSTQAKPEEDAGSGYGDTKPDGSPMARQLDYYNEVTPQQRKKKSEVITSEQESGGIVPLLLALVLVVIIFAGGLWYANRRPPREELLATIMNNESQLTKVQDEIKLFQKYYIADASNSEKEYIASVVDRSAVTKYANVLAKRKQMSLGNPPTPVEAGFLEHYLLAATEKNVPTAIRRMRSFLILYEERENLSPQDKKALRMARLFEKRWSPIAEREIVDGKQFINEALETVDRLAQNNTREAIDLLEWVIDSYENDEWASELINQANAERKKLEEKQNAGSEAGQEENGDLESDASTPDDAGMEKSKSTARDGNAGSAAD